METGNLFILYVSRKILGGKRDLRVRMQGLEYMNDDPSAVDVLYAKVVSLGDSSLLQNLVDAIAEYFIQQGLSYLCFMMLSKYNLLLFY